MRPVPAVVSLVRMHVPRLMIQQTALSPPVHFFRSPSRLRAMRRPAAVLPALALVLLYLILPLRVHALNPPAVRLSSPSVTDSPLVDQVARRKALSTTSIKCLALRSYVHSAPVCLGRLIEVCKPAALQLQCVRRLPNSTLLGNMQL